MTTNTQFPDFSQPFGDISVEVDPNTKEITAVLTNNQQWYLTFWGEYARGGFGGNVSIQSLTLQVDAIQTDVNNNTSAITTLNSDVNSIEATLSVTTITANQALAIAESLQTASANFLNKNRNLSDVQSLVTSRQTLKVNTVAYPVPFDILPASLTRYIPIDRALTIPANFAGSFIYAGVVPTNDAVFTIGYIRGVPSSPTNTIIGTMEIIHAGNYTTLIGNSTNLLAGDMLYITCPAVQDPTLQYVGITIQTTIT